MSENKDGKISIFEIDICTPQQKSESDVKIEIYEMLGLIPIIVRSRNMDTEGSYNKEHRSLRTMDIQAHAKSAIYSANK